jgi:predicted amidohydrolase
MDQFAIAGLQLEVANQDNRPAIRTQVERIKRSFPWVEMIVVGELASFGSSPDHAEPAGGETEAFYRELACENCVWLVPGSIFERDGDEVYNTALVINPQGEMIARYRKQFPFLPYEKGVSAGSDGVVFDVPNVGRFGLSICYDQWFPETTRNLVWMGAEVILCPTMTNTIDRDLELCIARANAGINQCYFFNINVAGSLGNGRSVVVSPKGIVLHEAGTRTEIIPVEVDLGLVRRVRERGVFGLGQVLKSFRDSKVEFPAYALDQRRSAALEALGPLVVPGLLEHKPK